MQRGMPEMIAAIVALRQSPPLVYLTGEEERVLFELCVLLRKQPSIPMANAHDLLGGKSRSSCYRTLIALHQKNLIDIIPDGQDRRKRYICLSGDAIAMMGGG